MSWQTPYATMPVMRQVAATERATPSIGGDEQLCLESLMPIELIRVHTKTDDIPSATDEQLMLYRKAAIESAEQFTGMLLSGSRAITEQVIIDITSRTMLRGYGKYTLEFPSMDGRVYLYGNGDSRLLNIKPRTRKIRVPLSGITLDLSSNCCRTPCGASPCAEPESASGMFSETMVLYRTGFGSCKDVPTGIVLGCLKFVAWCITHPGDEILAVRNRTITRSSLVDGTNNVAWASGALELWRQYDPEAI